MAGNANSGRWPRKNPADRLGHISNAERFATPPKNTGTNARVIRTPLAPQPEALETWHPFAQAWYRALGKSDLAEVAQPSDWMLAWTGAEILDQMYQAGYFTAGLLKEWSAIAFQLHSPRFDLLETPESAADLQAEQDAREHDEAVAATEELMMRLDEDRLSDDNVTPIRPYNLNPDGTLSEAKAALDDDDIRVRPQPDRNYRQVPDKARTVNMGFNPRQKTEPVKLAKEDIRSSSQKRADDAADRAAQARMDHES